MLTDGRASDRTALFSAASIIKGVHDTDIYTIGIANADITELVNVASSPHSKYLREIEQFSDLSDVADEWVLHLCPEITCTPNRKRSWFMNSQHFDMPVCNDPELC